MEVDDQAYKALMITDQYGKKYYVVIDVEADAVDRQLSIYTPISSLVGDEILCTTFAECENASKE